MGLQFCFLVSAILGKGFDRMVAKLPTLHVEWQSETCLLALGRSHALDLVCLAKTRGNAIGVSLCRNALTGSFLDRQGVQ